MFTFTFRPSVDPMPLVSRTTLVDTIDEAEDEAISMAADIVPDCELIEIEGNGASRQLIRRDGRWERGDPAQA